ncbi:50S ribosomal protein L9 [Candidatus Poribacteria bacterium]|nr:50S ribosomal protein L9 [Candidatus Poribacteria bacterium]
MPVEVILTDNVQGLGRAGEVVRVAPGFARNYLLPRDLAVHATEANRRRLDAQLRVRVAQMAQELEEAQDSARRLEGIVCIIAANAGENGRLFGSVNAADIADNLATKGITIDRRRIELTESIRELGVYPVPVRLHPEVVATIQVEVIANEA